MKYISFILIGLVGTVEAANFKQEDTWQTKGRLSGYLQTLDVEEGISAKEGFTQSHELDIEYYGPLYEGNAGVEARIRVTNDSGVQQNYSQLFKTKSLLP